MRKKTNDIMLQQQRYLLLKRLDVLSSNLKAETDSLRGEQILQEMRNIRNIWEEFMMGSVKNKINDEGRFIGSQFFAPTEFDSIK